MATAGKGKAAAPKIGKAELARARAALAQARGKRRLDVILDAKDPQALVRALPAEELYFTIREIGLGDAVELVHLASPAQFRAFIDLDAWKKDELDAGRALRWLRAARSGSLSDDALFAQWKKKLAAVDVEVVNLVLRQSLIVHDLEEDGDPHIESDRFMRSPEGKFIVEFTVEGPDYQAVKGLVDDLYAENPFMAVRLLSAIRWELPAELSESALRWRTGRLHDLGFPPLDEALSWFAKPPAKPRPEARPGGPARPPGYFIETFRKGSLLDRAAQLFSAADLAHLERQLIAAANAVLVAEGVDVADLDAVRGAFESARAYVTMGLEALAGNDAAGAAEALRLTSVKRLFQRGFGRVLELKWRAERLFKTGSVGAPSSPLLDPPLGEALAALARKRPLYFPGLAAPREEWGTLAAAAFEPRHFRSSQELAATEAALTGAEGLAALAATLGLATARTEGPLAPRLSTLYLTALANERLGRRFAPEPLEPGELAAAAKLLADPGDPRLEAGGEAGKLLLELASRRAEELAPLGDGGAVRAGHLTAVLVKG